MSLQRDPRRWTRSEFVRRGAAVAGAGVVSGGGYSVYRALADRAQRALGGSLPPVHRFHSRPDLVPPTLAVHRRAGSLAPGLLFLAPSSGPGQRGTLIVDNRGEPIWFQPTTPLAAMNFRAAVYRGRPVLTWWEGKTEQGLGVGTHVIADASYREVARVPAGNGLSSDLHEFILTKAGTALVTAWEIVERDLRKVGGPASGRVVGGVVQELDLPSGRVLFEWRSIDHITLEESYAGVGDPFDYFHVNSIAETDEGNLLVSARNTWAVYLIDRGSGEVVWRLGGKRSNFRVDKRAFFAWQHDARPHPGGRVSLFDDGSQPKVQAQSRGLVLALDTSRMEATLDRAYAHTPPLLAWALGSTQLLPNGNVLVGWGTSPYQTEFTADGTPLLDLWLPPKGQNYRALRFPWVGRPIDRPVIVASSITGTDRLYVSWNGATEVHLWQLRAGSTPDRLEGAQRLPTTGFETAFAVPRGARYAAAVALDANGVPLGASKTLRV